MANNTDIPDAFQHPGLKAPLLEWLKVIPGDPSTKRAMLKAWAAEHNVPITAQDLVTIGA